MKAVLQRVSAARVELEDGTTVSEIGRGLLVLLGVERGDGEEQARFLARKVAEVRVFPDDRGKMSRDVREVGGKVLVVSQFTLCADLRRGRRPGFDRAMAPDGANDLYLRFADLLRQRDTPVLTGAFGAMMAVTLVNDGPVTLILEARPDGSPGGGDQSS